MDEGLIWVTAGDKGLGYQVDGAAVDWAQALNGLAKNYDERLNSRVVGTEDRPVADLGHGGETSWLRRGCKTRQTRLKRGWRLCYC